MRCHRDARFKHLRSETSNERLATAACAAAGGRSARSLFVDSPLELLEVHTEFSEDRLGSAAIDLSGCEQHVFGSDVGVVALKHLPQ